MKMRGERKSPREIIEDNPKKNVEQAYIKFCGREPVNITVKAKKK